MSKVDGLAEAYSLFDQLPPAAEAELAVEMAILGREILAAQHADVAKDTGLLDGALSLQLLLERLKIRVGLLKGAREAGKINGRARAGRAGGPFYGRFVEFGRAAQTVLVTRRMKRRRGRTRSPATPSTRMRRRGPNSGTAVGSAYKMRVKALGGRPFVAQPLLQEAASAHLSDFWAKALQRLGGTA